MMGKKVLKTKFFFWFLSDPPKSTKFRNTNFNRFYMILPIQNFKIFFCNMLLINVVHINKKKNGTRSVRKKQLFIEIESLKIDEKVNIFKIAISHF